MRVHVELYHTLDPAAWRAQWESGLVPDQAPYGLHRLADHGFEVRLLPGTTSTLVRHAAAVARRSSGGFDFVNALRDRERRSCDLVLCWDERTGVPAALRSHLPGEPPVTLGALWLTEPGMRSARGGRLTARALQAARCVWGNSPQQLEVLRRDWEVPEDRLHLAYMGIDPGFWRAEGREPDPGLVVGAGNDRHRDHRLLLTAIVELAGRRPGTRFELATNHEVSVPTAIGRRHTSLTHVEMRELYSRAAVVAVATAHNVHMSGLSVVLEAMACARPVVATDTPGMREYLRDGETGVLVPAGDPDALAAAVDGLLRDPDRSRELGRAGRGSVESQFSTSTLAAQLADMLRAAGR